MSAEAFENKRVALCMRAKKCKRECEKKGDGGWGIGEGYTPPMKDGFFSKQRSCRKSIL
jgi:hypothetical protein